MMMYVLIGLCLVLTGLAGLQFSYLFYMDRMVRERKRYTAGLEARYARLRDELAATQEKLEEREALLMDHCPELLEADDESWAEVIEDR